MAPRPNWRTGAWLLFAAFVLHNVEEVATMRWYHVALAPEPVRTVGLSDDSGTFARAVAVVTAVALALVWYGTTTRRPWPSGALAVVMVGNVFVPHLPLAVVSGGYAPGVVTALLLTLPVGGWHLSQLRRLGRPAAAAHSRRGSRSDPA